VNRTRQEKVRLAFMTIAIVGFFVIAVVRLGQFQIVEAATYSGIVERQSSGKIAIPGERGMIFDRHGRLVAKNVCRSSLYAQPETAREKNIAVEYLARLYDLSEKQVTKRFKLKVGKFHWISRHLEDKLADRVAQKAPRGLCLREETRREYPFGKVGKQILGFTNIDNEGLSGFELSFDSLLAGQHGWADIRRDGLRNTFRVREQALVKPVPGQSVVLTIDWHLQEIVEEELELAVQKYNAHSGMAVFLDCRSGDILSMAHCDPGEKNPDRPVKLRAVTDQFEPGSVFKPFTAAALLDAGTIGFDDTVFCENGRWKTGRRILRDDKELGWLTFRQIIELSSNIGLGKCAARLGGPAMMATYRRFGFGEKLGCGLPGETSGHLVPARTWSDYNISALAMGHSVAVSALQMATAMAAVANGGELLRPHLLLGNVEKNGYVNRSARREVIGRAMKESSADSLRAFLRGVVENGTGTPANSEYVAIAGKTGTGQIPNLESGGYYYNRFTASFSGFFPSDAPVIAGIVVLENPHPVTYGGHTSGKAFKAVAERYSISDPDVFSISRHVYTECRQRLDIAVEAPEFVGRDITPALLLAEKKGVKLRCLGSDGLVLWQYPSPDRLVMVDDEMLVVVTPQVIDSLTMIDLKGLSIREASAFLSFAGINYTVEGKGKVVRQSIKPGQSISARSVCRLHCRPARGGRGSSG